MLSRLFCFNSLQTGKYIQRTEGYTFVRPHEVSIPFKRESISKVVDCKWKLNWSKFQFPSNGKVYPKIQRLITKGVAQNSFNSLQTGKYIQSITKPEEVVIEAEFQFPSNGKVYPKSNGEKIEEFELTLFQFPSNGKVYPKDSIVVFYILKRIVSIPFKRESISKETPPSRRWPWMSYSFNSLQTGKYIQRLQRFFCTGQISTEFQFPSNGKVYPKPPSRKARGVFSFSFNSLQTGKYIQSLETDESTDTTSVSIPFKRESISKDVGRALW